jgi:hypothetical protein
MEAKFCSVLIYFTLLYFIFVLSLFSEAASFSSLIACSLCYVSGFHRRLTEMSHYTVSQLFIKLWYHLKGTDSLSYISPETDISLHYKWVKPLSTSKNKVFVGNSSRFHYERFSLSHDVRIIAAAPNWYVSASVYSFHHLQESVEFIQPNYNGTNFGSCSLSHRVALSSLNLSVTLRYV